MLNLTCNSPDIESNPIFTVCKMYISAHNDILYIRVHLFLKRGRTVNFTSLSIVNTIHISTVQVSVYKTNGQLKLTSSGRSYPTPLSSITSMIFNSQQSSVLTRGTLIFLALSYLSCDLERHTNEPFHFSPQRINFQIAYLTLCA